MEKKVSKLESNNFKLESQLDARERTKNETNELDSPVESNNNFELVDQKKFSLRKDKKLLNKLEEQQVTIDDMKRSIDEKDQKISQLIKKLENTLDIDDFFF